MSYDFIKYSGILNDFKIYTSNVDYEKLFNDISEETDKNILEITELYYKFFKAELDIENTASISITLNSCKKIDKIPVKAHLAVYKNFKYINTVTGLQEECNKISLNVCLPSYEYVSGSFEMLQQIYLLNFSLDDENEFKKFLYNIIFYAYIIFRDFKFHPMLTYLTHKDEIGSLVNLKNCFISLFGESNDCSVCLDQTTSTTICDHYLCQKCFSQLREKICPSCRCNLVDENSFPYEDINIDI